MTFWGRGVGGLVRWLFTKLVAMGDEWKEVTLTLELSYLTLAPYFFNFTNPSCAARVQRTTTSSASTTQSHPKQIQSNPSLKSSSIHTPRSLSLLHTPFLSSQQQSANMSFQDRTQHQIGQIDKEVCFFHRSVYISINPRLPYIISPTDFVNQYIQ